MKKRNNLLIRFIALLILGNSFLITADVNSTYEVDACNPETATNLFVIKILDSNLYGFKTYKEEVSGFSFSYPETVAFFERFIQDFPYPEPERILKRISLVKEQMFLDIDIWLKMERAFVDWIDDLDEVFAYTQTNFYKSNSTLTNNQQYAVSIQQDSYPKIVVSMEFGDFYIQFTQKFTNEMNDYHNFVRILSSIRLDDNIHMVDNLGRSFIENINSYSTYNEKAIEEGKVVISADTCCGQSSPGNPFGCCSTDSKKGNCTWYVYRQYGYVPFSGDAMTWAGQVAFYPSWYHSPSPTVPNTTRSIGEHRNPPYGHVAYITSGNSSGVNGSEHNWCDGVCPAYFYGRQVNRFYGFIYHIKDLIP